MYETFDKMFESYNPNCFGECHHPLNVTSDCYLKCYSDTIQVVSQKQLVAPWAVAFARCPEVKIPNLKSLWSGTFVNPFLMKHEDMFL